MRSSILILRLDSATLFPLASPAGPASTGALAAGAGTEALFGCEEEGLSCCERAPRLASRTDPAKTIFTADEIEARICKVARTEWEIVAPEQATER